MKLINSNENAICSLNGTEHEIIRNQGVSYLNGDDLIIEK